MNRYLKLAEKERLLVEELTQLNQEVSISRIHSRKEKILFGILLALVLPLFEIVTFFQKTLETCRNTTLGF